MCTVYCIPTQYHKHTHTHVTCHISYFNFNVSIINHFYTVYFSCIVKLNICPRDPSWFMRCPCLAFKTSATSSLIELDSICVLLCLSQTDFNTLLITNDIYAQLLHTINADPSWALGFQHNFQAFFKIT